MERYRQILESAPDAVVAADAEVADGRDVNRCERSR